MDGTAPNLFAIYHFAKGVSSLTPEKSEREYKSDVPLSDFSVNQIWSLRNLS